MQQVLDITHGRGAYGALDCVLGDGTAKMVNAVRTGGTVLLYGLLSDADVTSLPTRDILFNVKQACVAESSGQSCLQAGCTVVDAVSHAPSLCDCMYQVRGFTLEAWLQGLAQDERQARLHDMMRLLEQGIVAPLIGNCYALERCKEAVDEIMRPGRTGKPLVIG